MRRAPNFERAFSMIWAFHTTFMKSTQGGARGAAAPCATFGRGAKQEMKNCFYLFSELNKVPQRKFVFFDIFRGEGGQRGKITNFVNEYLGTLNFCSIL